MRLSSADDFWSGLRGEEYAYDLPPMPRESEPLKPYLARFLRDTLHYIGEQIADISPEEAQQLLDTYHSRPPPEQG